MKECVFIKMDCLNYRLFPLELELTEELLFLVFGLLRTLSSFLMALLK